MSHTKHDKIFCDQFDTIAAFVGVKVFRSEYETIELPAWMTIMREMKRSCAMFLLIGKELVKAHASAEFDLNSRESWKYTQNWIAYEIGLECQMGIDIWVVCDGVQINFPIPYLDHYEIWGFSPKSPQSFDYYKWVFTEYNTKRRMYQDPEKMFVCPFNNCKAFYQLHSELEKGDSLICPTCLNEMVFNESW